MEICKHSAFCGGCAYQGVPYEEQLAAQNREVVHCLDAKDMNGVYLGIEGSPQRYRYRNKMEYTFGDEVKGGPLTLGMHQKKRFMSIVTVEACQLVDEDFNRIVDATLRFCIEKGYPFYNKKTHAGLLRHLILRKGANTGELLINLVTSTQGGLAEEDYVRQMLNLELNNTIVGILNTQNDKLADVVQCEKLRVLWGKPYYMERIMGLDFKVGAFSFFQTHVAAAERLYGEAIRMIGDARGKTVFDLYCGTGTIAQILAKEAKSVVGIEIAEEAVLAARENAERNGLSNCTFLAGDVLNRLENTTAAPDIIVLDPPRAGVHPKALEKIVQCGAAQIVYISCNPKTLAENLYFLQYHGYQVAQIKAFDNFPFTRHTEAVASLRRI